MLVLCCRGLWLEKPTGISHWEREEQSLLAHEITHGVEPQQPTHKGECSCRFLESYTSTDIAIRSGKIGRGCQRESHLNGEKDPYVHKVPAVISRDII